MSLVGLRKGQKCHLVNDYGQGAGVVLEIFEYIVPNSKRKAKKFKIEWSDGTISDHGIRELRRYATRAEAKEKSHNHIRTKK